jgi:hypothetical protein
MTKPIDVGLSKLEWFAGAATTGGMNYGLAFKQDMTDEDRWKMVAALEAKYKFIKAEAMLVEAERRRTEGGKPKGDV